MFLIKKVWDGSCDLLPVWQRLVSLIVDDPPNRCRRREGDHLALCKFTMVCSTGTLADTHTQTACLYGRRSNSPSMHHPMMLDTSRYNTDCACAYHAVGQAP